VIPTLIPPFGGGGFCGDRLVKVLPENAVVVIGKRTRITRRRRARAADGRRKLVLTC